ncbi:MAG: lysylphosphatidylglycerol synthase transmembrane domain-containing protein [Pseudomonadota bacterium]
MKPPLKSVAVLLGFAIGAVFIYLSISALDWASVSATFAKAELSWAIVALFFLGLAYALRLERWRLMLVAIGSKSSRKSLMAPFLGSFALNNVLPLRLGDAARATAFQKQLDVNVSGGVATLLIERVYDLYALLLIGFVSFLSLNMTQTSLPAFNYGPILAGLFLVLVILSDRNDTKPINKSA